MRMSCSWNSPGIQPERLSVLSGVAGDSGDHAGASVRAEGVKGLHGLRHRGAVLAPRAPVLMKVLKSDSVPCF